MKSYDRSKWEKVRLGDICSVTTGKLDANAMHPYGKYAFFTCAKEVYKINNYAFDTEALLISGNGSHVGYVHYYKGKFNAYQRTYVLDNFSVNIIFIKHLLDNKLAKRINIEKKSGNTPYILRNTLCDMEILKPVSTDEQFAIVDALQCVDSCISNLEKLISKQENIKKSTINLLLKPKADWIKKTIGDVCSFFTSSSKSAYIDPDGQYFIVDMGAVSDDGTLIAQKRTNYAHDFLHKNDLIMPKDDIGGGNIIGKAVAIQENDKYILSDHVYKLQTELDATFLSYLINSPKINKYMRSMATGSAQLGISKRTVSKCELCFPADLGQQKAIAQKLGAIDEYINNLKQQLKKQRNLKQGLMQYFFGD